MYLFMLYSYYVSLIIFYTFSYFFSRKIYDLTYIDELLLEYDAFELYFYFSTDIETDTDTDIIFSDEMDLYFND